MMDEEQLLRHLILDIIYWGRELKGYKGHDSFSYGRMSQAFFTLSYLGYFPIELLLEKKSGE